jgi:hypothetical protein
VKTVFSPLPLSACTPGVAWAELATEDKHAIFFLPQGRALLESKCPGYLSPGIWCYAQHSSQPGGPSPALMHLCTSWAFFSQEMISFYLVVLFSL